MPYRRTVKNREQVAEHASPGALRAFIREVVEAQRQADKEFRWLLDLYKSRTDQLPPEVR